MTSHYKEPGLRRKDVDPSSKVGNVQDESSTDESMQPESKETIKSASMNSTNLVTKLKRFPMAGNEILWTSGRIITVKD